MVGIHHKQSLDTDIYVMSDVALLVKITELFDYSGIWYKSCSLLITNLVSVNCILRLLSRYYIFEPKEKNSNDTDRN